MIWARAQIWKPDPENKEVRKPTSLTLDISPPFCLWKEERPFIDTSIQRYRSARKEGRKEEVMGGHTGEFFRRRDEWRKHPMLSNQLRHATPGLGIALVAFGVYLVGEQVYNRLHSPSPAHHSHPQQQPHSH